MNGSRPPGAATSGAWTAAAIVAALCLLSTITMSDQKSTSVESTGSSNSKRSATAKKKTAAGSQTAGGVTGANSGDGTETVVEGGGSGGGSSADGSSDGSSADGSSDSGDQGDGSGPTSADGTSAPGGGGSSGGGGGATAPRGPVGVGVAASCANNTNAGSSDVGVSSNQIKFAATVVQTGIAADFLADAQYGIEAVRQKVNRAGGICGRLLNIRYDNDGWDTSKGQQLIEGYIGSKQYFGLAVNPSSEGLRGAIKSGVIDDNEFPVVGADGMLIGQYQDPWVWPVATSTHSVMHIMVDEAYKRGARTFGIVYDQSYRFGVEGHDAYKGEISRLSGATLVGGAGDMAVTGGAPSYKTNADNFKGACGGDGFTKCDFVALLLEPPTAAQWRRDGGLGKGDAHPKFGLGAPQPLFVDSFARKNCGSECVGLRVWTSFKPPIPPFDGEAAVATYKTDVRAVSSTADLNNPHVEGAYVGMELLVAALKILGPAPTRADLRTVLDSITFDSGLGEPLTYAAGNHFAAISARGFDAIYNVNTFEHWADAQTGWLRDNAVQQDITAD